MMLKIDGVDMLPYIALGGLKWSRNDVEDPDAGRTLDGVMHRGRVATKIRLDVTCIPMTGDKLSVVLNAILPETVQVQYDDPMYGNRTVTMYSNNNPATVSFQKPNGTWYWSEITFPLIEV